MVPDEYLLSSVVPIPKGRNVNLTDSNNYRGITLKFRLWQHFDLTVLERYGDQLNSSELRFGFKKQDSTTMCFMVMNEFTAYYMDNRSIVHCVFLDAAKTFDKDGYRKLFRLLKNRNIPTHIIRLLVNMYTGQQLSFVDWDLFQEFCR
jgi:Reverse transcriptase (RNA-dependent DNA polymerase)